VGLPAPCGDYLFQTVCLIGGVMKEGLDDRQDFFLSRRYPWRCASVVGRRFNG